MTVPDPREKPGRDGRTGAGTGEGNTTQGLTPTDVTNNVDGEVENADGDADADDGNAEPPAPAEPAAPSEPSAPVEEEVDAGSIEQPVQRPDDSSDASVLPSFPGFPSRDAGEVSHGPDGDPWRGPPPENRPRFAYRCREDYECSFFRGVCDHGFCVQCRSRADCPPSTVCNPDRVCVRLPPSGSGGGSSGG